MKFGRRLLDEANPRFREHYIAYKDLKQAIKLITGADASEYSIAQVTSNFGNKPAFAGSVFRPPESRFQDLLNAEKGKINKFLELTLGAVNGRLRQILKDLNRDPSDDQYAHDIDQLEAELNQQGEQLIFLESYLRLNFIGFRKITKKYDKHNKSNSSAWYMAQLATEPFMNIDFDDPTLRLFSVCQTLVRQRKQSEASPMAPLAMPVTLKEHRARYLLKPEELMRLKVLLCQNVPLTALGSETCHDEELIQTVLKPLGLGIHSKLPNLTHHGRTGKLSHCCVYFDTQLFDTYRDLVAQRTLLSLKKKPHVTFRLRWAGTNEGEAEKDVYLEKVDVRTEFADCKSEWPDVVPSTSPTSIVLKQKHLEELINGTFDVDNWCERKGQDPGIVKPLINEAKTMFKTRFPVVQVHYYRSTYRLQDEVRGIRLEAHLDEQVQFVSEVTNENGRLTFKGAKDCKLVTATQARAEELVDSLPFAVLTLSLALPSQAESDGETSSNAAAEIGATGRSLVGSAEKTGRGVGGKPAESEANRNADEDVEEEGKAREIATEHLMAKEHRPLQRFVEKLSELSSVTELWGFNYFVHGVSIISKQCDLKLQPPHWNNFVESSSMEAQHDDASHDEHGDLHSSPSKKAGKHADSITRGGSILGSSAAALADSMTTGGAAAAIGIAGSSRIGPMTGGSLNSSGRVDILRASPSNRVAMDSEEQIQRLLHASQQSETPGDALEAGLPNDGLLPPPRCLDGARSINRPAAGFLSLHAAIPVADSNAPGGSIHRVDDLSCPLLGTTPKPSAQARHVAVSRPQRPGFWRRLFRLTDAAEPRGDSASKATYHSSSVRVEPKTFFANERTLLQWLNVAVLLATIGITLLNFGSAAGRVAGLVMAPVAVFFIVHAYMVYARRGRALERKEPIDYADRTGPFVLVVTLVASLTVVIILNLLEE